ncbi:hypothetical protein, partial [Leclercia adecarboxylata]|uniref:hypothetical protein n=1 Tax=Leclercia adecarboxylata TaxID=83655 RepID=UPI00234C3D29
TALVLFLAMSVAAKGQQMGIMAIPCDTASRINRASIELYKAGHEQRNAVLWGLVGAAFTMLSADKAKIAKYDHNATVILGGLTVGGFVTFQLKSAAHTRKAAMLLHQ